MIRKQRSIKPKSSLPLIIMISGLIIISIVAVTNNYWSESDKYFFSNVECKPYFEFDEVIHYQSNIHDFEVIGRKNNDLNYLLFGRGFESLQDSIYLEKVDSLFHKKIFSKENHVIIDKIFCNQVIHEDELYFSECIAIYRDVFVFRKKNKITGIVKVCFDCDQFTSVGSKQETKNFGLNHEFSNLTKLIKKMEN